MKPEQSYELMLKNIISPGLRNYGFVREKASFYYRDRSNTGIIDFQKSKTKGKSELTFTVNIGVVSYSLLKFLKSVEEKEKVDIYDAQWEVRLGELLPQKHDVWWTIDEETVIDQIGQDLLQLIENLAIPEIRKNIHDASLRDLWLSGQSPSITDFQRLLYLSFLLKTIGPIELLEETITELNRISANKPTAITAQIYLEKLQDV